MQTLKTEIIFRAGRTADLERVREICRDVWDGHDYLPSVWEEWLTNPNNVLFMLEKDGQVAAFYCLQLQVGELYQNGWLKGLRVAAEFRRQGLAGVIIEHAIAECRKRKFRYLRYGTGEPNTPMHKLGDQYGFDYIAPYSYLLAPPLAPKEDGLVQPEIRQLHPAEFEVAWNFIQRASIHRSGASLHCIFWNWQNLERELLQAQLTSGYVYGCFEESSLAALAIAYKEADSTLFVGWLDGTTAAVTRLATFVQLKAAQLGGRDSALKYVAEYMLVRDDSRDQILQERGFQLDPQDYMRVYELQINVDWT